MELAAQISDSIASIEPAWIQAGSTVILAGITLYYSRLIKSQIQSERRREHSNTLRESVSTWLDNCHPLDQVKHLIIARKFHIIPDELEHDPYVTDFRDNHAPEVDRKVQNLNKLIEDFEMSRRRYEKDTPEVKDEYFPFEVNVSDDTELKEIIFYVCLVSDGNSITDINGVRSFTELGSYTSVPFYFPDRLFTEGYGSRSESMTCVLSRDAYGFIIDDPLYEGYDIADFVAGEFEDATAATIRNMPEEQKSYLQDCNLSLDEFKETYQALQGDLRGYNREAIYPGYCKFVVYNKLSLWLRSKINRKG